MPPYAGQVAQFGPPPRFAPGYAYAGYAPKKSNAGAITAVVMIGVFVVVGGLIATFALSGPKTSHVADAGYQSYPTSATTYSSPTSSSRTITTSSRATTSTTRSTSASVTPTSTSEAPETPSGPQPSHTLATNPLFSDANGSLQNQGCSLARWSNSPEASAAFFTSALPCLNAVWAETLAEANLPFHPPKLAFPSGNNWSSPCGDLDNGHTAAFYCSTDETLYMPYAGLQIAQYGAHPGVYLAVFAHEYGHHVQNLSGVSDTYWQQRYDAGTDSAPGLELSRRLELQAQCFSGMFLGSTVGRGGDVDRNIYNEAWNSEDRGDGQQPVRDHGSNAHAMSWWQHGAQTNRTQQCNTWASSSGDIS
ncbi:MAG: Conserved putative rane protein [Amycolatopsis sp.]|nr:Conserved putative rane protein [Amycolatopsis sp.]